MDPAFYKVMMDTILRKEQEERRGKKEEKGKSRSKCESKGRKERRKKEGV